MVSLLDYCPFCEICKVILKVESLAAHVFLPVFYGWAQKSEFRPGSPPWFSSACFQGKNNSDSEECLMEETEILPDKKWFESLETSEQEWLKENIVPDDELEDKKVVCTSCFKQGNHKQKVKRRNPLHSQECSFSTFCHFSGFLCPTSILGSADLQAMQKLLFRRILAQRQRRQVWILWLVRSRWWFAVL